jgi:tripartite-type tricarboxylate transporter receptor subunit TctC
MTLVALAAPAGVQAQSDYPNKTVRIIVGFTPGGGPDITARYIAQQLGSSWKQQVIVENRPGAGGTLAAAVVARAAPDGYTLLSVSSAHAAAAAIYPKLPYVMKELSGITQTGSSKYVLVVAPSLGITSLRELLQAAKAKPGQLNFSSAGVGSGTHFAAEILKSMAAIDVVHVPFKGIPEALSETLAGRVQFFMAPIANSVNYVKDGRLVGLGVSSFGRDSLLPEVPTVDEAGVPGYQSELWFGLLTSSGVPRAIIDGSEKNPVRPGNPGALGADRHRAAAFGAAGVRPTGSRRDRAIYEDRAGRRYQGRVKPIWQAASGVARRGPWAGRCPRPGCECQRPGR